MNTSGTDSSTSGISNALQSGTTSLHATGAGTESPVNADQLLEALQMARSNYLGSGSSPGQNALQTWGDNAIGMSGAAARSLGDNLGGQYLNSNPGSAMLQPIADGSADGRWSNPYADQAFNQGASQIEGRMRSAFGGSDSQPGGGLEQAALANGLANLGTQIYLPTAMQERQNQLGAINQIGANYAGERSNMLQAAGMMPGVTAAEYQPALAQIGASNVPINTYLQALSAINPGKTSTSTRDINSTMSGNTSGTNSSSGGSKTSGIGIG